jgi:hypothetical protein
VQAVEVLGGQETSSYVDQQPSCYDPENEAEVITLTGALAASGDIEHWANPVSFSDSVWYDPATGDVKIERPAIPEDFFLQRGISFRYKVWLHGRDHPLEPPRDPWDRIMSWRYEINHEGDPRNIIREGGGVDDLASPLYDFSTTDPNYPVFVDDNGVWIFTLEFFVPQELAFQGAETLFDTLLVRHNYSVDEANAAFDLITVFLGDASVTVVARDATNCLRVEAPLQARNTKGKYHYYAEVRTPTVQFGRHCDLTYTSGSEDPVQVTDLQQLALEDFGYESQVFTKYFKIQVKTVGGDIYP